MNKYEAYWTGERPNLCHGEWKLYRNGEDISHFIPMKLRHKPMKTRKRYCKVSLTKSYEEFRRSYRHGWFEGTWVALNYHWLCKIGDTPEDYAAIYKAIRKCDWRHFSCGGCI